MVRMDWVPSQDGLRQILQLLKVDQPLVDHHLVDHHLVNHHLVDHHLVDHHLVDHHLVDYHILNLDAGVPESRHSNTEGGAEET